MNICFLGRPCFDVWRSLIAKKMHEKTENNQFVFIPTNQKETKYIQGQIKDSIICESTSFIQYPSREEAIDYLAKYFHFLREGNVLADDPITLDDKNITKITNVLIEKVKALK